MIELNDDYIKEKITSKQLWDLTFNLNSALDVNYTLHGVTVGYLLKLLSEKQKLTPYDENSLILSGIFVDAGHLETEPLPINGYNRADAIQRCIGNYTFFKHIIGLEELAKILLNHHSRYKENCDDRNYILGQKVHIACRIDLLIQEGKSLEEIKKHLIRYSKNKYNPKDVEDFCEILDDQIIDNIKNKVQSDVIRNYVNNQEIPPQIAQKIIKTSVTNFNKRNKSTIMHSLSTSSFAVAIASCMGIEGNELFDVCLGAVLHDVGKEMIPQSIIDKPGKLTKDEFEIVKNHPLYTYILLESCMPYNIVNIASRHHEKLDGSGYPFRLDESQLSIEERIVIVADIISALYAKRSYKEAFSDVQVFEELEKLVLDNKIDPMVVKCFESNFKEITTFVNKIMQKEQKKYENAEKEFKKLNKNETFLDSGFLKLEETSNIKKKD